MQTFFNNKKASQMLFNITSNVMKAKIMISKECAESQALKYGLLGGLQRMEECEMVCPFTVLFNIVFDAFSFPEPQIKPHTLQDAHESFSSSY